MDDTSNKAGFYNLAHPLCRDLCSMLKFTSHFKFYIYDIYVKIYILIKS